MTNLTRHVIFCIIISTGFAFFTTRSFAQPFPCDGKIYLSQFNNNSFGPTSLVEVMRDTSGVKFGQVTEYNNRVINGIGYSVKTGFIYGTTIRGEIVKMDRSGNSTVLGTDFAATDFVQSGDVATDGTYVTLERIAGRLFFYEVEPGFQKIRSQRLFWDPSSGNTSPVTRIFADIVFHPERPNTLISYQANYIPPQNTQGYVVYIDADPNSPDFGMVTPQFRIDPQVAQAIGALFIGPDGTLYGYGRNRGMGSPHDRLIKIDLENEVAESLGTGPRSSGLDGCSCPKTMALQKTVDTLLVGCDSTTIRYLVKMINYGNSTRTNLVLTDSIDPIARFTRNINSSAPLRIMSDSIGLTVNIDSINAKDTIELRFSVRVPNGAGSFSNRAFLYGVFEDSNIRIPSDDATTMLNIDSTRIDSLPSVGGTIMRTIDTILIPGDTLDIFGEPYSEEGRFIVRHPGINGCDTITNINIILSKALVTYTFDDCLALTTDQSNENYSEFDHDTLIQPKCGDIDPGIIYRRNPTVNKHSCTPGVNMTPAMCVGSLDSCDYLAGHEKSIRLEIDVSPNGGSTIHLWGLTFYERAPSNFDWIQGPSGLNNPPQFFGIRVLVNGTEVYQKDQIQTQESWNHHVFNFSDKSSFRLTENSTVAIELLPYCLVGNNSPVSAWDIDELELFFVCTATDDNIINHSGRIVDANQQAIDQAKIDFINWNTRNSIQQTRSSDDGSFTTNIESFQYPIAIRGDIDDKSLTGISVEDIILIKRYLLGIDTFLSPTQYIAADVNKSSTVSVADIAQIRKRILGKIPQFPNKGSWEVGIQDVLVGGTSPFDFYTGQKIDKGDSDYIKTSLIGIKTGDVSGDASHGLHRDRTNVPRGTENLIILDRWLEANKVHNIKFIPQGDVMLEGLQLFLETKDLSILGLTSSTFTITQDNYNIGQKGLTVVIAGDPVRRLSSSDDILNLEIEAHESGYLSDMINIDQSNLSMMVGGNQRFELGLNFTKGNKLPVRKNEAMIYPNPAHSYIQVNQDAWPTDVLRFELITMTGRRVFSRNVHLNKLQDNNLINLPADLPSEIYIYKISSEEKLIRGLIQIQ